MLSSIAKNWRSFDVDVKTRTKELQLPIAPDLFLASLKNKIDSYEPDAIDKLVSVPPHIQWDNIKVDGDELVIEKRGKPLDRMSRYSYVSGKIHCKWSERDNMTLLQATFSLNTSPTDVLATILAMTIALSGLMWLAFDFNVIVLIALVVVETAIILGTPKIQEAELDDLGQYFDAFLEEVMKE